MIFNNIINYMTKVDKNTSTSDGSNSRVNILSTNNRKNNKNSK